MPIVNYVREHTRFIQYASDEHIPANERLLWYALMHIMNQRAQGNVGPDEFIRINNDLLLSYCAMRYDTMAAARNGLKQRGLIDYEPGKKNQKSPAYRMIYFFPEYVPSETDCNNGCNTIFPDNIGGNIGGNIRGNIGGNIPNNIINYTNNKHIDQEEDDDEDNITRAREEAKNAWKLCYGKTLTDYIADQLATAAVINCGFAPGVLTKAIRMSAKKNAESPYDYVLKLMSDWQSYHLHTESDVDEYLMYRDAAAGKQLFGLISPEDANERLRMMIREKRDDAGVRYAGE